MCSLRDAAKDLESLKSAVFALSLDDVQSQKKFVAEQQLSFPLLSDPDASATAKFGVLMEGKPYANRVTFVIDDKGVVRLVERNVQVATHGADLVTAIRKLQSESK